MNQSSTQYWIAPDRNILLIKEREDIEYPMSSKLRKIFMAEE
ncbi:MAG: hypothetical protein ACR5K4_00120 [Sodalis sp. (in: enterobacteria)]